MGSKASNCGDEADFLRCHCRTALLDQDRDDRLAALASDVCLDSSDSICLKAAVEVNTRSKTSGVPVETETETGSTDSPLRRFSVTDTGTLTTVDTAAGRTTSFESEDDRLKDEEIFSRIYYRLQNNETHELVDKAEPVVEAIMALGKARGKYHEHWMAQASNRARVIHASCSLLADRDDAVRQAASSLLLQVAAVGNKEAVQALCSLLSRPLPATRVAVLDAICHIAVRGDACATRAASAQTQDLEPEVRLAALEVLSNLGDPADAQTVKAVVARLADRDEKVRCAAEKALAQIAADSGFLVVVTIRSMLASDSKDRLAALYGLAQIADERDEQSFQSALPFLIDQSAEVRKAAALAVAAVVPRGHVLAAKALANRIADSDAQMRWNVLHALGKVGEKGDRMVLAAIVSRLHDSDQNVQCKALQSAGVLAERGDRRTVRHVSAFLASMKPQLIDAGLRALAELVDCQDTDAIQAITEKLEDGELDVRNAAVFALERIRATDPIARRTERQAVSCTCGVWRGCLQNGQLGRTDRKRRDVAA